MKGILITRPEPACFVEVEVLRAQGIEAFGLPAIVIESLSCTLDVSLEKHSDDQREGYLIITSQNAVRFAHPTLLEQLKHLVEAGMLVVAMGNSTAQASLQAGLGAHIVAPPGSTSEWVLALPEMQALSGKTVIVLTGQNGRGILQKVCMARHAELVVLEVYQRRAPDKVVHPWKQLKQNIDTVSITSFDGAKYLFQLVPEVYHDWLLSCLMIVPSHRVKQAMVAQLGVSSTQCSVARGAHFKALLEVIRHHE